MNMPGALSERGKGIQAPEFHLVALVSGEGKKVLNMISDKAMQ